MNILIIGPSLKYSKGGISSVSQQIKQDQEFNKKVNVDFLTTYIDSNKFVKGLVFLFSLLKLLIIKDKYDIFQIQMASGASFYRKSILIKVLLCFDKKVLVHMHSAGFKEFFRRKSPNQKTYIRNTLKQISLLLVLSNEWSTYFTKKLNLGNVQVLMNGVQSQKFEKCELASDKNKNIFLVLGRLGERKGTYDILEAVQLLNKDNIKIYFAGDGDISKVNENIHKNKLEKKCEVLGWINLDEKLRYLSGSATLLLPSYAEGLPVAILEAMAAGKMIIASNVGGIPSLVKKENGILVNPGNIEELATAMKKITSGGININKIGKNNRKLIKQNYDLQLIHKKLFNYYMKVLEEQ